MTLATICSGIGAPEVALHGLGWQSLWAAQYDPEHDYSRGPDFPSTILAHRFPGLHNYGDFTKIPADAASPDVLIGGTPCQAFSVAGLRGGLADPRGGLTLAFISLVGVLRPRWIVWENVPGVLSSDGGAAFGSLLSGLAVFGYGWAYRVLDAQYFGLAQRRKRVFVVAHSGGDWRRAGAVLFEPEGVRWHSPPSRAAEERTAGQGAGSIGGHGTGACESTVSAGRAGGDLSPTISAKWRKGRGGYAGHNETENCVFVGAQDVAYALAACNASFKSHGEKQCNYAISLGSQPQIRRLTIRELERLQGFPDDFTAIPWRGKPVAECPDAPRAKALGNSMAVPVLRWIGRRIEAVDVL
jgi:DNA (cytosine-5)-methyltransferase 1